MVGGGERGRGIGWNPAEPSGICRKQAHREEAPVETQQAWLHGSAALTRPPLPERCPRGGLGEEPRGLRCPFLGTGSCWAREHSEPSLASSMGTGAVL